MLTLDDFSGAVGEAFDVGSEGQGHVMRLVSATPLANSGREGGSFRLEFEGPVDPVFPQAIYPFRRADGEEHEIFVVPIARDAQGTRYEAVFF